MTVIPRRAKTDAEKNAFDRALDQRKAERQARKEALTNPLPISPKVQIMNATRRNGIAESQDLRQARIAEEQRRASLKNPTPAKQVPIELGLADTTAIFNAFVARTPQFFNSPWNRQQITRFVQHNIAAGKFGGFTSSALDSSFQFLSANGYMEGKIRHRGQEMPKTVPEYVAPPPEPDINARIPLQQPAVRQTIPIAERQRLMAIPLEELSVLVRSGYKKEGR